MSNEFLRKYGKIQSRKSFSEINKGVINEKGKVLISIHNRFGTEDILSTLQGLTPNIFTQRSELRIAAFSEEPTEGGSQNVVWGYYLDRRTREKETEGGWSVDGYTIGNDFEAHYKYVPPFYSWPKSHMVFSIGGSVPLDDDKVTIQAISYEPTEEVVFTSVPFAAAPFYLIKGGEAESKRQVEEEVKESLLQTIATWTELRKAMKREGLL